MEGCSPPGDAAKIYFRRHAFFADLGALVVGRHATRRRTPRIGGIQMGNELGVLWVADSEADALRILQELRRAGFTPALKQVASGADLAVALGSQAWDLVLAAYGLAHFSALEA